jgi:hypothetical protein
MHGGVGGDVVLSPGLRSALVVVAIQGLLVVGVGLAEQFPESEQIELRGSG